MPVSSGLGMILMWPKLMAPCMSSVMPPSAKKRKMMMDRGGCKRSMCCWTMCLRWDPCAILHRNPKKHCFIGSKHTSATTIGSMRTSAVHCLLAERLMLCTHIMNEMHMRCTLHFRLRLLENIVGPPREGVIWRKPAPGGEPYEVKGNNWKPFAHAYAWYGVCISNMSRSLLLPHMCRSSAVDFQKVG